MLLSRSCVSLKGLAGSGSELGEPTKVNGTVHAELLHLTGQDSLVVLVLVVVLFFLLFHIL